MAVDPMTGGRREKRYGCGISRAFRRISRSMGRNAFRIFHLDDRLRQSIQVRMLEREIEDGFRDLGEFIYTRIQDEPLDDGDLTLLDLMRTELARRLEEKKSLGLSQKT